ncbi:unnamed protein product [Cylicostephanus goldi]|uniref:Zinc metalloproteinase n=1 Tax=Cylicostephanus goldi TaxID=71465 RepID=A0A3P6QH53_CYLGO|nr:unnamed protein product [Cylicostephanus goldi]
MAHWNGRGKLALYIHGARTEQGVRLMIYRLAPERIELVVEPGCWSYVGNVHKVQPLSLGQGCEAIGLAAHEIGHALGFYHHHARHDRDEHLIIDETKVKAGEHDQFIKQTTETNDNYGLPYEFGSIMHYGSRRFVISALKYRGMIVFISFSADKSRWHTMIPVDRRYIETLGSHFVSFYDKLMMNTHYNCLEKCKSNPLAAKCAMGGFPNPKDCSKCVCPGGYGGRLCNERPNGCGNVLQATTNYLKFEDIIGQSWIKKTVENDFFLKCHYWIEAPLGRIIEVKFHNYSSPGKVDIDGCYFAGVEIKTQKDQRSTGYRQVFKSESNIVPIITYSRVWPTKTELWYRMGRRN